jgi:hypothetical protein
MEGKCQCTECVEVKGMCMNCLKKHTYSDNQGCQCAGCVEAQGVCSACVEKHIYE